MKIFLNDKEVTLVELKLAFDNLDYGPPDGGTFEIIALSDIDTNGNMHFDIERFSAF